MRSIIVLCVLGLTGAAGATPPVASQPSSRPGRYPPRLMAELMTFLQQTQVRFDREQITDRAGWCKNVCDGLARIASKSYAYADADAFLAQALRRVSAVRGEWSHDAVNCVAELKRAQKERTEAAARETSAMQEMERRLAEDAVMRQQERAKAAAAAEVARLERETYDRCTKDRKCLAARIAAQAAEIVEEICSLIQDRRDLQQQIARERKYARKVGVVNLRELQDLKEQLMTWDERLVEHKVAYRDLMGKPFSGRCRP